MYKCFVKRVIDVALALGGLTVLCVPIALIAIAIKLDSKGPVFFRQQRFGLHKKPFEILKFRTMRVDAPRDVPTFALNDPAKWITRVGGFLRKTSLDELPQIFNILAGQMSVIGPRPVILNEVELINERDKYGANDILPGITGWAQINGRDELRFETKARLDGEYVKRMSLGFDCWCFFATIVKVLRKDGVVEGNVDEEQDKREEKSEKIDNNVVA